MTGFGQCQVTRDGVILATDIQCLNSRFFDVTARLPRVMQKWEPQIRKETQEALVRGKVNVTVTVGVDEEADAPIRLNRPRLRLYHELFKEIQDELDLPDQATLSHFAAMSDVFVLEEGARDELYRDLLLESLGTALAELQAMRLAEGANLAADLRSRVELLQKEIQAVEQLAAERRAGDLDRFRDRIQELLDGIPVDEGRLLQEAAILAEKRDITEECTRLKSHLDLFHTYVEDEVDTGKRLGFLLQEMGREVNTLGAKTDHIDINHIVVRIKNELEKIREQVQNIL
ncbi:MAG: YicC family protein [Fidelibacterota bacterium]|nr:MAG: YicC family protein [Candidatus Neomarinimicrobiota bacterium]